MMDAIQRYWSVQTSSMARSTSDDFQQAKALEHAALFRHEHLALQGVDLGCGAGELLRQLVELVPIVAGVDFSPAMLEQAAKRLHARPDVQLICDNALSYVSSAQQQFWTSTAAVNQYLDCDALTSLVDVFVANEHARAIYFFDCVDHLRYRLLPLGVSYVRAPARGVTRAGRSRSAGRSAAQRLQFALQIARSPIAESRALDWPAMGFGYLPRFWMRLCRERSLAIEVVSSRYYEYRYHVIIEKT